MTLSSISQPTLTDADLLSKLREIVGPSHLLTGQRATERFRSGFRSGGGEALCVVQPGSLLEQWQVLQACVATDKIVDTSARFNADQNKLYEAAGCAGKLAVFAVRLDTFPKNDREKIFYIGANDPGDLADLRRHILANFKSLPVSAEYMQREVFKITEAYGKDTVWMIDKLGTSKLQIFSALKGAVDARLKDMPGLKNFTDRIMQVFSRLTPQILPQRLLDYRDRFEHHLILKMKNEGIEEAAAWLPMLRILDGRGAEYPAEHNVGHLYQAKPDLSEHYKLCDPTNSFNPGIGKMSRRKNYA